MVDRSSVGRAGGLAPSCRRFKSCRFTEPGERSLRRSTDQSTGANSQRNAERIENIPFRKELKIWNNCDGETADAGDDNPRVKLTMQVQVLLTVLFPGHMLLEHAVAE